MKPDSRQSHSHLEVAFLTSLLSVTVGYFRLLHRMFTQKVLPKMIPGTQLSCPFPTSNFNFHGCIIISLSL